MSRWLLLIGEWVIDGWFIVADWWMSDGWVGDCCWLVSEWCLGGWMLLIGEWVMGGLMNVADWWVNDGWMGECYWLVSDGWVGDRWAEVQSTTDSLYFFLMDSWTQYGFCTVWSNEQKLWLSFLLLCIGCFCQQLWATEHSTATQHSRLHASEKALHLSSLSVLLRNQSLNFF